MKKLYLVTETFPYGTAEKTFIIPELDELVNNYDVTIISHASQELLKNEQNRSNLDKRIKVINVDIKLQWYKRLWYGLKYFCDSDGVKELRLILKSKEKIFLRIYQSIGFYALALENLRLMRNILDIQEEAIYYTYWFFYYTYSITKEKKKCQKLKVVTRTHGFDLYEERFKGCRQPFKEIMDANIDRIFFISKQGKQYYLNKYRLEDGGKYVVSRLGTNEYRTEGDYEQSKLEQGIRMVSCSALIPLKRVELIVEALSILNESIEWIHFGSGIYQEKITILAKELLGKKKNITYDIKGFVPNDKILDFYSRNYVDCFITASSSEGIPVSIQEAMSFGIPVIATNVGGTAELINGNGILLSADPCKEDVADAIREISHMPAEDIKQMRKKSRRIWERDFNSLKNSRYFIKKLKEIY